MPEGVWHEVPEGVWHEVPEGVCHEVHEVSCPHIHTLHTVMLSTHPPPIQVAIGAPAEAKLPPSPDHLPPPPLEPPYLT